MRRLWLAATLAAIALLSLGWSARHSRALPRREPLHRNFRPLPVSEVVIESESMHPRILRGIYPGGNAWRWAAPSVALALDPPDPESPAFLELDFNLPVEMSNRYREVTVTGWVNGVEVGRRICAPGRQVFAAEAPRAAIDRKTPVEIEFRFDRSYRDAATGQERSAIFVRASLIEYERTVEYREKLFPEVRKAFDAQIEARKQELAPAKRKELLRLFHDLPVWNKLEFLGAPIVKNPLDLWMVQQIVYELRPDFIVETGTFRGGSALYWAYTLNAMGLTASRVITVDIDELCQEAAKQPLWRRYVEFIQGSSTDPKVVAHIASRVRGKKTMVMLDSDHRMFHVLKELKMYSPMVSPGSYLIVEDTHMDGVPTYPDAGLGPFAAVRRFLDEGGSREFEVDYSRERLVLTYNPGGWLRRK